MTDNHECGECPTCGACVKDAQVHAGWHEAMAQQIRQAAQAPTAARVDHDMGWA